MKKVGALVVTFNRITLLKEAIDSLRLQTFKDMQIVVVNNGSTDGTKEWLEMQEDIYTITQDNSGGAGGFFTGMKYIAEAGYEYCWLMDDDVECSSTALSELLIAMKSDANIGFVCSKVIGIQGEPMNIPEVDTRSTKNGYPYWYDRINDYMVRVVSASFVSILLSTEKIFELGLPYKDFFIWGDDLEYTLRISKKYNSYIVFRSEIIHKREIQERLSFETETNQNRLKNYFYMYRNLLFIDKKQESKKQYLEGIVWRLLFIQRLIVKRQIYKAKIIFKSLIALISFNPVIEYPTMHIN